MGITVEKYILSTQKYQISKYLDGNLWIVYGFSHHDALRLWQSSSLIYFRLFLANNKRVMGEIKTRLFQ